MFHVQSPAAEVTHRRASTLSTYFVSRIVIAILLTGMDVLVVLKSALACLRNSIGMPVLHWLLLAALAGIGLTLVNVWVRALRYRQPTKSNSHNPFL
jgi:uncharacterized integral membrane protein